jgi:uncharacterized DUF497 family protein
VFEWDFRKAKLNRAKHRVSFEEAATVSVDPMAMTIADPDHSVDERRFIMFGTSTRQRLLVVSFTWRRDVIRIISARVATPEERKIYEES